MYLHVTKALRSWLLSLTSLCLLAWCLCAYSENNIDFTISGVSGEIKDNITQRLSIFDRHESRELPTAALKHLSIQGIQEIKLAIMPYGYFHPKITSNTTEISKGHWQTHYDIKLGPRLLIKKSSVTLAGDGNQDPDFVAFLAKEAPKKGQYFSSIAYENAKNNLLGYAFEHGYLDAELHHHTIVIDRQLNTCTIKLQIRTGQRFKFGPTSFSGSHLDADMLARYPHYTQGEPYNENELRVLQSDLIGSGYFNGVNVNNHRLHPKELEVPIQVKLAPGQTKHYQLGIGYGTDTGPRTLASLHMNQLNRHGHKLSFSLRASKTQQYIEALYTIPGYRPATQHYMLATTFKNENDDKGRNVIQSVSGSYSLVWRGMHMISGIKYQHSKGNLANKPTFRERLLLPNINLSLTNTDHPVKPNKGYNLSLLTQGADESLGSTLSFVQAILHGKRLQPLDKKGQRFLMLRGATGYTATHDQEKLPVDYQFYVGGSQSIRGYGYHKFGPGADFIEGSIEFRQRLHGDLYGAAFFDAGNTGNTIRMNLHKSVGVGLVYRTVVGSFNLSLAKPLKESNNHIAIEFSMGPEL